MCFSSCSPHFIYLACCFVVAMFSTTHRHVADDFSSETNARKREKFGSIFDAESNNTISAMACTRNIIVFRINGNRISGASSQKHISHYSLFSASSNGRNSKGAKWKKHRRTFRSVWFWPTEKKRKNHLNLDSNFDGFFSVNEKMKITTKNWWA